jgi:hypothetical protein
VWEILKNYAPILWYLFFLSIEKENYNEHFVFSYYLAVGGQPSAIAS